MEMLAPQPGRVRVVIDTDTANGCRNRRQKKTVPQKQNIPQKPTSPQDKHSKRLMSSGLIISVGRGRVAFVDRRRADSWQRERLRRASGSGQSRTTTEQIRPPEGRVGRERGSPRIRGP